MELILHPETTSVLDRLKRPGFYITYGSSGIGKKTAILQSLPPANTQILQPEKSRIKIDQIAELVQQFHLKSRGTREYIVIDDAHCLTTYAQNSLLKTLEELPGHVSIIMVTHEPEQLLPTIQSRAFFMHMPAPSKKQVEEWLSGFDLEREDIPLLLETTGAKPAALSSLLGDKEQLEIRGRHRKLFEQLCRGETHERLLAAAKLQPELPDVLENITQFARNRLRQESGLSESSTPTDVSKENDPWVWQKAVMSCEYAQRLQAANTNKKLVLDVIALGATR